MAFNTSKSQLVDPKTLVGGPNGYDTATAPSNEVKITASDSAADDFFGRAVAAGSGRIVVSTVNENGVYAYDLNENLVSKITAFDSATDDDFGSSIAVGNGRIVIGAPGDEDNGEQSGSAYIYDTNGSLITKITASDNEANDSFGTSVAVGSGRIVIGATGQGSAYVFDLDGNELYKIVSFDTASSDSFGNSVAVGNGRIIVGQQNSNTAFIFGLDGNTIASITASDDSGLPFEYGRSVAIGSGRIVVGAPLGELNGIYPGSAYVYDLNGTEIAKINASDAAEFDRFGFSVAVGSGRIIIGARGNDDNGSSSGSAYIFDLDGNELTKITASDASNGDDFGFSVASVSNKIVIGTPGYSISVAEDNAGAAYIYTTPTQTHYLDYLDNIL